MANTAGDSLGNVSKQRGAGNRPPTGQTTSSRGPSAKSRAAKSSGTAAGRAVAADGQVAPTAVTDSSPVSGVPSRDDLVSAAPVSLLRRFCALLVDWFLCLGVTLFFRDYQHAGLWPLAVLVLEYAFFIGLFGQTPGMYIASIRCVSHADGSRIGILRAGLRGLLLCLVLPPFLMDDERRGLHDRVVGSVVLPAVR